MTGKGVGVWDTFAHAGKIKDGMTGDIVTDGYHKYLEDVKLLTDLKVKTELATSEKGDKKCQRKLNPKNSNIPILRNVIFGNNKYKFV